MNIDIEYESNMTILSFNIEYCVWIYDACMWLLWYMWVLAMVDHKGKLFGPLRLKRKNITLVADSCALGICDKLCMKYLKIRKNI